MVKKYNYNTLVFILITSTQLAPNYTYDKFITMDNLNYY